MAPPIFILIKLLFDPDVSKKMILKMAYRQISAIGVWKVLAFLLSTSMVGVSSIIKTPQIKKIIKQEKLDTKISVAKGLSLKSIHLELLNQLIHWSYNSRNGNMFITYGESVLVGIQNVIIEFLISYYRLRSTLAVTNLSDTEQVNEALRGLVKPLLVNLGALVLILQIIPDNLLSLLQAFNIPLSIAAKVPQILKNHELKSTKHLSPIPIVANAIGSAIRIFTTVQMKGDKLLLAGYSTSFVFNAALAGQCYYYSKKDKDEKLPK